MITWFKGLQVLHYGRLQALSFQRSVHRLPGIPRTGNDVSKSAFLSNPGSLSDFNRDLGVPFVSIPRLYLRLILLEFHTYNFFLLPI